MTRRKCEHAGCIEQATISYTLDGGAHGVCYGHWNEAVKLHPGVKGSRLAKEER